MAHAQPACPAEGAGPRPRPQGATAAAGVCVLGDFLKRKVQVSGRGLLSAGGCVPGAAGWCLVFTPGWRRRNHLQKSRFSGGR